MQGRWFYLMGVLLLMALLMFTVSCDSSGGGGTGDGGDDPIIDRSYDVYEVSLSLFYNNFQTSSIENFFGKTDTVLISAKAVDDQQVGVENAKVLFSVESGPGYIVPIDTATNVAGIQTAHYIVSLASQVSQTAQIKSEVIAAGVSDTENLSIVSKPVRLTMHASADSFRVAEGGMGTTQLTITVVNDANTGVSGIPVQIEAVQDPNDETYVIPDNAVLSPVSSTGIDGSVTSTLNVNPVDETIVVWVRAFVDVDAGVGKGTASKGIGALRERMTKFFKPGADRELDAIGGGADREIASDTEKLVKITMIPLEGAIDSVYVWVTPPEITLTPDSNGVATIFATAFDDEQNGITDLQFHFSITDADSLDWVDSLEAYIPDPEWPRQDLGVISQPQPTDTIGTATATIRTNRQFGEWWINVNAGEGNDYRTKLMVNKSPSIGGTLRLTTDTPYIYADNGITKANITATLKDQNQSAIEGAIVRFSAIGSGNIQGSVVTDSFGVAVAQFSDGGEIDTVQILATYTNISGTLNLNADTSVVILPNRQIGDLILQTPFGQRYNASIMDSAQVVCTVRYTTGEPAVPGTPVNFNSDNLTQLAFFPPTAVTDADGQAVSYMFPGSWAGVDTIFCSAGPEGQVAQSLRLPITIEAKDPKFIANLMVENFDGVSPFYTNQQEAGVVHCVVVDTFLNPVRDNLQVTFTTNLGTVTPSASTGPGTHPQLGDINGYVRASFTPGTQAGLATVIAKCLQADSSWVSFTIHSGTPQSLILNTDRLAIAARGTGGQETAQVSATVRDPNGNSVQDQTWVYFLMDRYPDSDMDGRPKINDSNGGEPGNPYGEPYDSAMTNSGIAQISINAGVATGQLRLLAWAYENIDLRGTPECDSVLAIFTELAVVAGPPASIDIDVNEIGEDGGGAVWNVEVSARVADILNNPVKDSIVVAFEVSDDIATIGGEGAPYTGNEDPGGDITPGVAHTIMSYNSAVTNDSIDIIATVLSEGGNLITGEYIDFNLPIQTAAGVLYADPRNWDFTWGDPALFHMTVFVYDGHDHCINDQLVRFITSRGQYYAQAIGGAPLNEAITGPGNVGPPDQNDCGWADRYLRITFDEAFPDPRILETTATAEVEIVGYPDATVEPVTLNIQQ